MSEQMIEENRSLAELTWWKIGGNADFICFPKSVSDVASALNWARSKNVPVTVLGAGSNVLVSDRGVEGLVVCMKRLTGATARDENGRLVIECLAGTPKAELVKHFLKTKLSPALFLCGLPGDVGGGVAMNAGVSEMINPREFCEITDWIEVLNAGEEQPRRLNREQIEWTYRSSRGWQPGVIVRAGFSWPLEPNNGIMNLVKQATKSRLERQPLNLPSCGSVFKNPDAKSGVKAGALIDQAGLKGYRVGGAEVSTKHANFIVNIGGATAADVDQIIKHVQRTVFEKFNVQLHPEVKYLGRW